MTHQKDDLRRHVEVLSSPAFANREANPYNSLLYDHMLDSESNVLDYSDIRLLLKRCDIVHIHWPEYFFFFTEPSTMRLMHKVTWRMVCLYLSLLKGTKVFWTVHNLHPHEKRRPRLEKIIVSLMVRRVDSLIVLNRDSQEKICQLYPALGRKPTTHIPLCHYRTVYKPVLERDDAKAVYGIASHVTVLGYFGRIRGYKNVPAMIRAFKAVEDPNVRLLVNGACADPELKQEILSLAENDSRVRLWLEELSCEQLANVVTACDVSVLPYKSVLNSGAAFLSLSLNRPVLLPETEAFRELSLEVGAEWVRMYGGALSAEVMEGAVRWARQQPDEREVTLDQFDPQRIADETLMAYREVLGSVR